MKLRLLLVVIVMGTLLSNGYAQWELTSLPAGIVTLESNGTTLFAGGGGAVSYVYASTDSGTTWNSSSTGIPSYNGIKTFAVTHGVILAGSGYGATNWRSTDNGQSWKEARQGLPSNSGTLFTINQYISRNDTVFAAVDNGSHASNVFMSADTGKNWTDIGFSSTYNDRSIVSMGGHLYGGTQYNGVFRSSGIGAGGYVTWTGVSTGLPGSPLKAYVGSIVSIGSTLIASAGGIYKSTDEGANWSLASAKGTYSTLYAYGSNLFWSGDSVYQSSDMGATWQSLGSFYHAASLHIFGGYLYICASDGVYRRHLAGIVNGVAQDRQSIPSEISLSQNYPNPFNPSTSIRYTIARQEPVSLMVYDLLGRVVATLVQESQAPGEYTVSWAAGTVPSGTYYYRLTTPSQSATGRMILVK